MLRRTPSEFSCLPQPLWNGLYETILNRDYIISFDFVLTEIVISISFFVNWCCHFYFAPSAPDLSRCRFWETFPVAAACSCYFLCQKVTVFGFVLHAYHHIGHRVSPNGVVGSCNFCCHPSAACTAHVPECFNHQTQVVNAPRLSPPASWINEGYLVWQETIPNWQSCPNCALCPFSLIHAVREGIKWGTQTCNNWGKTNKNSTRNTLLSKHEQVCILNADLHLRTSHKHEFCTFNLIPLIRENQWYDQLEFRMLGINNKTLVLVVVVVIYVCKSINEFIFHSKSFPA